MQQVRLVTGSVVTKPFVDIHYADLMEHREPVTRSLAFIGDDRGNQILIHGRSILYYRPISNKAGFTFHWTVCPKRCASRNSLCSGMTAKSISISAPSRSPVSRSGISQVTTRIP